MPNDDLLKYFIDESNKKFIALNATMQTRFDTIDQKLADLKDFKTEVKTSSKWVALIISSLVGLFTFVSALATTLYVRHDSSTASYKKSAISIKDVSNEPNSSRKH